MKKACNSSNQSLQLIYEIKNMIFTTNKKNLIPLYKVYNPSKEQK